MPLADYDPIINAAADEWNLDPKFLRAVLMQENGAGNPHAVSTAGAIGLGQLMPGTAKGLGVDNPYDPVQSIYGAAKYLDTALKVEGTPEHAAMFYHGGPGWRGAVGPESQAYVPGVTKNYMQLAAATTSPEGTMAAKPATAPASDDDVLKLLPPAPQPSASTLTAQPANDDDVLKLLPPAPVAAAAPPSIEPTADAAIPTPHPAAAEGPARGELPSYLANDPGGALQRIADAAKEGYYSAPDLLAPGAQATVDKWGSIPAAISRLPGTALGLVSGAYRGLQQMGIEQGLPPDLVSMPDAFAGSPHMLVPPDTGLPATMPRGPYTPPGPNLLAAGVEPVTPGLAAAAGDRAVNSWLQQGTLPETSAVPQRPPGAPITAPATAAEAKAIANAHYATAPQTDSGLTPQFNKKLVDAISPARETESLVGKNDAVDLVEKLKARADKPLSIRGVQETDEDMTQLIEQHRDPVTTKLDKVGQQIDEIQDKFREQIDNATPGDTSGGPAGFEALQKGRAAWTQYRKMDDVERMWNIAQTRKVPQTNFENRVGTYLNSKKAAGWSAEEKASLMQAAKNGMIENTLHLLGNKLLTGVTGAIAGAKWGLPGVLSAEAIAQGGAAAARALENRWLNARVDKTLSTLGGRVPPSPLLPTLPPVGASGPPASPVPYWAAPLAASTQQPPERNWLNPNP